MSSDKKTEPTVDLHGAAIIDKNGKEVPITESMLAEAFDKLTCESDDQESRGKESGKASGKTQ